MIPADSGRPQLKKASDELPQQTRMSVKNELGRGEAENPSEVEALLDAVLEERAPDSMAGVPGRRLNDV